MQCSQGYRKLAYVVIFNLQNTDDLYGLPGAEPHTYTLLRTCP